MLTGLYIRDFAVIHALEVSLDHGLTVLTGETGAGKSILIDALALALGTRAETGAIRHGATRADISASFQLPKNHGASRWLADNALDADGECVLRRVIEADKGSKGFINARPVPIQMLRELGELLVDIHGQHEHQSLLKRDAQRQLLDDYAGLSDEVAMLGTTYTDLKAIEERLDTLKRESSDRESRLELLRFQVNELQALDLKPGEVAEIEEEHKRLANGAELLGGAQLAAQILTDDEEASISTLLTRVSGRLEQLAEVDPKLADALKLVNEATINTDEAAGLLHQYLDRLELDPNRLQWLDERLGTLHDLARKHRVDADALPAVLERLATELADIEDFDVNLDKLEASRRAAETAYREQAGKISKARAVAAKKLAKAVTDKMQELGMAGGKFEIALAPLPQDEISATGLERIEFLVSANPGQPVRPLNKVASGGELSRISLAIQVVIASLGRIPTLIFDEVDVGVGGRVAEIVGQLLRDIGGTRQVLCITHLAQVAALGHHHVRVNKDSKANETWITVTPLSAAERVEEIARMIGGVEISKQTIAHAKDMLDRAAV